jgi:hypothetical protein
MATGPVITCEGADWTLVFDGAVNGQFNGSAQSLQGRAYLRVAASLPSPTVKGFALNPEVVIPLVVPTNEKVYARPINGRSCEVVLG